MYGKIIPMDRFLLLGIRFSGKNHSRLTIFVFGNIVAL